ncbi:MULTISPECIES: phytanoyl-CoA dioxygenase family protein [Pseudomonas]|uniref:Ectoine hydroxylase-related dioxygenase, phytanoyl-CoA dioxygenase (PhyH) family n=1 Tax=Pseudomonas panipatensis TaxID=428992 RepID=A0A1G8KRM2_9PSED|nr:MULTISPECIES: phytanoyl-CoA dioxygenase family protein [Pseudomonas]SDI46026.1 Ectoine hydroxylase-related dioxygenase, phytanoyl-CoA dioxygenase (PhyH) family [Pseudomonas panipatensis]SMP70450.1 Ectoine hydroxylase-related dioxygenase, phytanoyl-CoA dioxygenase (PhyH) family [Pseudomonas panipatensis]
MDHPVGTTVVERLQTVPCDTSLDDVIDIVQQDGAVVLDRVLSEVQVAAINAEIDAAMTADQGPGEGACDIGCRDGRTANLVSLSKTFRDAFLDGDTMHGLVLGLFDAGCEGMWLSRSEAFDSRPGDEALPLGRSLYHYPVFLPCGPSGPEVTCSMYVALSDSSPISGAVRVIPGSHEWDFCEPYEQGMTIPVPMTAGSVLFCSGKLVHGVGANYTRNFRQRLAVALFNIAPLVPLDAHPFRVPAEVARDMSVRVRQMTGFHSFRHRGLQGGRLWQLGELPGELAND